MACWNSADLCAVRFSLLDTDGSPLYGEPDGTVYTMQPISLAVTPTTDAGETVTTRTGCGDICYTRTDPDVETGADLVLTLCSFDPEFIALAIGAEVITEAPSTNIGWAKGTTSADPVESHFWTKTFDGSSQVAAPNNYWHHVFPRVTWTLGSYTLGRDVLQMVLNGTAAPSGTIVNGGFDDIPTIVDPYFVAAYTAEDIPDPDEAPYDQNGIACGFVDTPAASS
jgi:hypothetical protein